MMKKLLLFALLAPLAMQPMVKAEGLLSNTLALGKTVVMPWTWHDQTIKNRFGDTLGKKVDLVTKGLEVACLVWGLSGFTDDNTKASGRIVRGTHFTAGWLPKLFSTYSLLTQGSRIYRKETGNPLGHFLSIMGLFGTFYGRVLNTNGQNAVYRSLFFVSDDGGQGAPRVPAVPGK